MKIGWVLQLARRPAPILAADFSQLGAALIAAHLSAPWKQPQPVWWLQTRGLGQTSAGGSSSSSESEPNKQQQPQQEEKDEAAAQQPAKEAGVEEVGAASAASSVEPPLESSSADSEQATAAEQAASRDSIGDQAATGVEPSFGQQHPELQKYIQQLKQLKRSSMFLQQEVGVEPLWWQTLLQTWVGSIIQQWCSDFVQARIEKDFEAGEFLEGAKDAYWIVHQLLEEEDWESLKAMTSSKLFSAFQDTVSAYKADGLVWRTAISQDLQASIRGLSFATKQQMAEYAPEQAVLAPDEISLLVRPGGLFLVLTVRFQGEAVVTITRQEDGQVVAELKDKRPVCWKFATGPLPGSLPVNRLDMEWFLLSI